jgi:hypothetical protein
MKTYVTPEHFEKMIKRSDVFGIATQICSEDMDKAGEIISRYRQVNRRVAFICHTCTCDDDVYVWKFMYGNRNKDKIKAQLDNIFAEVFAEDIDKGTALLNSGGIYGANTPCVCPFSAV